MNPHISSFREGFSRGCTCITRYDDRENASGIGLGVLRLQAGERVSIDPTSECAWILMQGEVRGEAGPVHFSFARESLFDESASCVHASAGTAVQLEAQRDSELTVYQCANRARFAPRIFNPQDVPNEARGRGQVGDRALRYVRTIFDRRNSPPEVELVLGEVVTFPGGWSSYPPHHHVQPEIYHYRFTAPSGFGHAELGETVLKVRQYDTVLIPAGLDHAQCAAPGYGMYYSWVIRHLPNNPYIAPEFTPEHVWTLQQDATYWHPPELSKDEKDA